MNSKRSKSNKADIELGAGSSEIEQENWDEHMLIYLSLLLGLIEGRKVSYAEMLELLEEKMRQQGLCRKRRIDYTVAYLKNEPP